MGSIFKTTAFLILLLGFNLHASNAWASHAEESAHSASRVYYTALRYLRVDQHFLVVEKDEKSGYLLFEYPGDAKEKSSRGSIEVIETDSTTRLIVRLERYPRYYEESIAAGVLNKLKEQYGDPPERPSKQKKESKEDAESEKKNDSASESTEN